MGAATASHGHGVAWRDADHAARSQASAREVARARQARLRVASSVTVPLVPASKLDLLRRLDDSTLSRVARSVGLRPPTRATSRELVDLIARAPGISDEVLELELRRQRDDLFYASYARARRGLLAALSADNPDRPALELLRLAQRILDRVVFICFCEDRGLMPRGLLEGAHSIAPADVASWPRLCALFEALDRGTGGLNRFSGGLFSHETGFEGLVVGVEALEEVLGLSAFQFDSEFEVGLLGHCFEQSIGDLEEIRSELSGARLPRNERQRQREGVYYTPPHITRYIVEAALGAWLERQRSELGFDTLPELDERELAPRGKSRNRRPPSKAIQAHIEFWTTYRERVATVRVLDMACGSGAFLVAVLDRLRSAAAEINQALARFRGGQIDFVEDLDPKILERNIYGVDLSEDAVEIARLSLWIKTVRSDAPLTSLDENIRWGDALVADSRVTASAFPWDGSFRTRFDVIVGNPPYDVLSARETGATDLTARKRYFRDHPALRHSLGGKQNLYKIFLCQMIDRLAEGGVMSVICPMALMGDLQARGVRNFVFERCTIESVDTFPQKDDPHRRVFRDAKQSTCILTARAGASDDAFQVRVHSADCPDTPWSRALSITPAQIDRLDRENRPIPSCLASDWAVVEQILSHPGYRRLGSAVKSYQGEVNETTVGQRGGLLTKDPDCAPVLRGSNVTMYAIREASQGEVFHIVAEEFRRGGRADSKVHHADQRRIGFQRSSPQNNFRRIIAAPIEAGNHCFDTISYVRGDSSEIDLDALLALLNSRLLDYWFRLTSSNSKVNEYQFNALPWIVLNHDEDEPEVEAMIAREEWEALTLEIERRSRAGTAPGWAERVLSHLARELVAAEAKRALRSRSERSSLGEEGARLQERTDRVVYALFALSSEHQDHIDARLHDML
jgi:methylase of polypeptide subunit release factors